MYSNSSLLVTEYNSLFAAVVTDSWEFRVRFVHCGSGSWF